MLIPELIAIFIFSVAAVFGLLILPQVLRNKPTPKLTVLLHGMTALIALSILWLQIYQGNQDKLLLASTLLFTLAVLDGIVLFGFDLGRHRIPKLMALLHTILSLIALILLVVYILR